MRKKMRKSKDRKVFRHTATTSKKINLSSGIQRGGIRL